MSDCAFCEIAAGRGPADVVQEWDETIAFLPRGDGKRRGCTEGHILVVPKTHVRDFREEPAIFAATALRAAQLAGQQSMDLDEEHWNVLTSAGKFATQTIFHLHIHLVPRREDDGLLLPWSTPDRVPVECLKPMTGSGRSCVEALADGWITSSDLCSACTAAFMTALDGIGGPLKWHQAFQDRAAGA